MSLIGCNCKRRRIEVFEVELTDGTVRRVLTLGEVEAIRADDPNAIYRKVAR